MYISLYVDVNTFIGGRQPQNKLMRLRTFKKKKKERKTRHPEGCRSQEAKAIATSKIVVNLPEFTGKDLSEFAENFGRFLRLTSQTHASGRVKCDLLLQCCKTKYLEKQVRQIVTKSAAFADVLVKHLGGGQPRSFPSHARPQTPKPMKSKTSSRIQDCPKNSVILASAMTQSGVLGKEMKVYVDKKNM